MEPNVHLNNSGTEITPISFTWHRYIPMALTMCMGLGLTIGLFSLIRHWEHRENQTGFDVAASHHVEAIRRATERIEMVHEIMRQDYYGSATVSRNEFSLICDPFLAHVPSLKVLQWAPRVSRDERATFEKAAQEEGIKNYHFWKPGPHDELQLDDQRDEYFPIWYAATRQNFQARLGWDFSAIPILQSSMAEACNLNRFTISSPIRLEFVGNDHLLIQTFLPVYRDFQRAHTTQERQTNLSGYVVGLCQLDDLVDCALEYAAGPQGVDLALLDESLPEGQQLLHFHESRRWARGESAKDAPSPNSISLDLNDIHYTAPMLFGGHKWRIICTPSPAFFAPYSNWRSWTLLAVGLLVTYMMTRYAISATTRTERIERIVAERTHELRQKDEQLRQSQKLEAVGSLAGGIAHEFNNLLQAIGGYTRYAMESLKPEEQAYKDLESVLQASDRAVSLTRQLLSFSRRQTVDRRHLDANEMVSDLTRMLRPLLGEHIKLNIHLGDNAGTVYADAGSFQQVLVNLCLNARDAMPTGGEITVTTERTQVTRDFAKHYTDLKPGPYVAISVTDTGHGMSPEVQEHIFEPFFTTKPIGHGTGLGLPTVYGIVQQHEGSIHVYSEPGHGSTFKIYLPAIESESDASPKQQATIIHRGNEVLLMAEDDPMLQDMGKRILEQSGYSVLTANDGEETLQMLYQHSDKISLVLLDTIMPKLNGQEVYFRIKEEFPKMPVIFCSGYDPESTHASFMRDEQLRLVEKPYNAPVLLQTIREVLDAETPCQTS
jgi:signal transduction histidine kinase/CheY-like chemotaxis protein